MSDDTNRSTMTRRGLLGSTAIVGVAATGAGAGTWALFQNSETTAGNSVQTGTIDLTRSNSGDFSFSVSNVAPGDGSENNPIATISVTFSHDGTIPANHLEIDFDSSGSEGGTSDEADTADGAAGMAGYIVIEDLTYNDGDDTTTYVDGGQPTDFESGSDGLSRGTTNQNETSWIDLDDLDVLSDLDEDSKPRLDDFTPPTPSGGTTDLHLKLSAHEDMPNDFQGDTVTTTITATLNQAQEQNHDID